MSFKIVKNKFFKKVFFTLTILLSCNSGLTAYLHYTSKTGEMYFPIEINTNAQTAHLLNEFATIDYWENFIPAISFTHLSQYFNSQSINKNPDKKFQLYLYNRFTNKYLLSNKYIRWTPAAYNLLFNPKFDEQQLKRSCGI